jgi:type I restriction enzyme S subunit
MKQVFCKGVKIKRIAFCCQLSTLDNLIEAQDQKITQLKQHKKGLMQQLFVSSEVGV